MMLHIGHPGFGANGCAEEAIVKVVREENMERSSLTPASQGK